MTNKGWNHGMGWDGMCVGMGWCYYAVVLVFFPFTIVQRVLKWGRRVLRGLSASRETFDYHN